MRVYSVEERLESEHWKKNMTHPRTHPNRDDGRLPAAHKEAHLPIQMKVTKRRDVQTHDLGG